MATIYDLPLHISRSEVLRYLGLSPARTQLDNATDELLGICLAKYTTELSPRGIALTFEAQSSDAKSLLDDEHRYLGSPSLTTLLSDAKLITIMVVTLGLRIDIIIDALFAAGNYAEAVILDAIGSDAVEQATEALQVAVRGGLHDENSCPTRRVSPGYGDIELSYQKDLLRLLNGQDIGVELTSASMLKPRKSITAVVGWLAGNAASAEHKNGKCEHCHCTHCAYRHDTHEQGDRSNGSS